MASERLDAAGRLAAWIAHQINNPLGAISGNAQLLARRLQRDIGDPEALGAYLSYLEAVQNQTERCARITAEALNFTQIGEPDPRRLSVPDVVSDAVELVRYGHPECCVNLSAPAASKCLETRADREWLTRAVFEVLANAVQASDFAVATSDKPGSGPVEIAVGVERKPRRPSEIRIGVSDSGPGIPEDVLPRIFDPFFSTKDDARGLGLTLALDMMLRMNGRVAVERTDETGSVVAVYIPAWGENER